MKKKHIIITVVVVCVVCALIYTVYSLPKYPDFQKEVDSYAELKAEQPEKIATLLPENLELDLTDESYTVILDGRSRKAKGKGFIIAGKKPINDNEVRMQFYCESNNSEEENTEISKINAYSEGPIKKSFSLREEHFFLEASCPNISDNLAEQKAFETNIRNELDLLLDDIFNQFTK